MMTAYTFVYWVYPTLCVAVAMIGLGCMWLLVRAYKQGGA